MSDARFEYDALPSWRGGTKQVLQGSEYTKLENTNTFNPGDPPRQVEFDLEVKRPIIFDMMSRFVIEGSFETAAAGDDEPWTRCAAAESADVVVCPNWWENLVRNIDLFHGTYVVKCHDEPLYVQSHLNQCLYWQMDLALKKLLCVEDCHTGNAIPTVANGWGIGAQTDWQKYSASIFTGANIKFNWSPLFFFPFYQGSNFVYDEVPPRALPLNHVGKLSVRMTFKDDFQSIFRKRAGVTKKYRFNLQKVDLYVEEARLNVADEKRLYQMSKKILYFTGVTKICRSENIPEGTFVHNCKFENVAFPESIFIFAVPRTVVGGTYKYSTVVNNGPHYTQHRISQVLLSYGGMDYTNREPNFGTVKDDLSDMKALYDHVKNGPFGLFTNSNVVTRANVANGFENTDFPHWYMSLTPSGNRTRVIPLLNDGSAISKNNDLIVTLKFNAQAAPANTAYFIYLGYTDGNMTLDLKTKKFESPYLIK